MTTGFSKDSGGLPLLRGQSILQRGRILFMPANGTTDLPSSHSVKRTIDRLIELLRSKGIKIFARIDQAQAAKEVGLSMRPTELLLFGDPRSGTPLMNQSPSLAIDLPLKAVAWESEDGKVYLTFNTADYLIARHHLAGEPFKALEALFADAAE
jgi:uncharacterized protein (DUF302 family)